MSACSVMFSTLLYIYTNPLGISISVHPSSVAGLDKCYLMYIDCLPFEPRHGISKNDVCATSKVSDQPAHTRSLIRAFASRLPILGVLSY